MFFSSLLCGGQSMKFNKCFKSMILNSISIVSTITPTDTHFTNPEPFFTPSSVPVTDPATHPMPWSKP